MPSKRDLIKGFRVEVKQLEDKVLAQALAYRKLEQKFESAKDKQEWIRDDQCRKNKYYATSLSKILDAELMWQELSDDPTTKIHEIKKIIQSLQIASERHE